MALLAAFAIILSVLLAVIEYSHDGVKDFLDRVEPIASEVGHDVSLVGLGVVVTLEVENPESIKMGMDRHVHCV